MKKYIIIFLALTCNCLIHGQTNMTAHSCRLSFEPQFLLINGLKLNFDKRTKSSRHWLIISPSIYYKDYNTVQYDEYEYAKNSGLTTKDNIREVKGAGLAIENKLLLTDPSYNYSLGIHIVPYLSYGITYNFFEVTREDEDWIIIPQDGINYMQLGMKKTITDINKTGLNFSLGLQTEIIEDIIAELYLGCGIRYSFYTGDFKYNKSSSDYGFKGVLLIGGFKIGAGF